MHISILLSAALIAFLGYQTSAKNEDIFLNEDQYSGLVNLGDGDDIFYWLFKSRDSPWTDPLVLWFSGGPGCSSEVSLFYENGPYIINDDMTLKENALAWN